MALGLQCAGAMAEQLENLSRVLNLPDGGLLKLACDVSNRPKLQSVALLTRSERLALYLFLYDCAVVEGRVPRRVAA